MQPARQPVRERLPLPELRVVLRPVARHCDPGAMSRDARDPSELSVGDGIARYLRRRRADSTESSVEAWKYRLKLFREWAEEAQIESVNELRYALDH